MDYRTVSGDVSLPENAFRTQDFLPHGKQLSTYIQIHLYIKLYIVILHAQAWYPNENSIDRKLFLLVCLESRTSLIMHNDVNLDVHDI